MKTRTGREQSDRGAAAVEMALVLPVLLLLVFGIIDFGRMLNAQITLTEAAREGARASVLGADPTAAVKAASTNLGSVGIDPSGTVSCPANPKPTDNATVTTTYTFKFVTPVGAIAGLFGGTFGGDLPMTGVGVMPCDA